MDSAVQTQTASLAINGSPGASHLVCHGPWSVTCLADTISEQAAAEGVRVDGGYGQHGDDQSPDDAGAHGDYLLVGALISGRMLGGP